jgi:hypothetical protein
LGLGNGAGMVVRWQQGSWRYKIEDCRERKRLTMMNREGFSSKSTKVSSVRP